MRELLALSEAGIALAQARQGAVGAREQLIRLVGLWGETTRFTLPERLPALPSTPTSEHGLEATALRNHPRLSVAATEAERARRGVAPGLLETWTEITTAALSRTDLPAPDADDRLGPLLAPGMVARLWGYNGQSPGPAIEVVDGDRVRIFVTNRLPEHTSIHWHGQRLPNGMDGVGGLNQRAIPAGKTFVYEFVARRPGTFIARSD